MAQPLKVRITTKTFKTIHGFFCNIFGLRCFKTLLMKILSDNFEVVF